MQDILQEHSMRNEAMQHDTVIGTLPTGTGSDTIYYCIELGVISWLDRTNNPAVIAPFNHKMPMPWSITSFIVRFTLNGTKTYIMKTEIETIDLLGKLLTAVINQVRIHFLISSHWIGLLSESCCMQVLGTLRIGSSLHTQSLHPHFVQRTIRCKNANP